MLLMNEYDLTDSVTNAASNKSNKKYSQDMKNVNYEWVELPSKGQCYPINSILREGKIKVSYLTATDENIIISEKLINEKKVCDILLANKVLDVNASELCAGDKEAIILWLRKTGYGNIYKNQFTKTTIDLDKIKYKDFKLISDNDGNFNYYLPNGGKLRFRYLPYKEEEQLIERTIEELKNTEWREEDTYVNMYMKMTILLLRGMIVSVDNVEDIEKWLLGLNFDTVRRIQRYITHNSPGLSLETTEGTVLDDSVFYNITIN